MIAVGMIRRQPGIRHFELPLPQITQPDEVLVRVKEVGLDGTDFNMLRKDQPDIAADRSEITLGHEMVGVVESVGESVKSLVPGDIVTMTVRRGCGRCEPCRHNRSDMCLTGLFTERGIHQVDGFLSPLVVDREPYIVKVPPELARVAVITEPLSIAEKAIEQIRLIQSRLPWTCPHPEHNFLLPEWGGCKTALVMGQGPLGLLAAALLRLANLNLFASDIVSPDHPKVALSRSLGAVYIDARIKTPGEMVAQCCQPTGALDVIIEASGAADFALRAINSMSRSSIYVMTGIPPGDLTIQVDAAQLVRQLVRYNQVIVGSVNSNRYHFEKAIADLAEINQRFHHLVPDMLTHRFRLEDYARAFTIPPAKHIKTVIEIEPW